MHEQQRQVIRERYEDLASAIRPDVASVVGHLFASKFLSQDMKTDILENTQYSTPKRQARRLLDVIQEQGDGAFASLHQATLMAELGNAAAILEAGLNPQSQEVPLEEIEPTLDLDDEILRKFNEHQELVKSHRIPLTQNNYIALSALERVGKADDGPAKQILTSLLVFSSIVDKIIQRKSEELRSNGCIRSKAIEKYIELTSHPAIATPNSNTRYYYVLLLQNSEELIAAVSKGYFRLLDPNDKKEKNCWKIESKTKFETIGIWQLQVKFRQGNELNLLTRERQEIVDFFKK